jgi:hypothetical protein
VSYVVNMTLALTSNMNPIVRAMRANIARRDNWAQIRVGACALLLPPLTLGAAFYSMMATPDEGAARPSGAAAKMQVVRPELLRTPARAVGADAQPAAQATQPIATPDQPTPERGVLATADMAQADLSPAQVSGAPLGKLDGSPGGARLAEPSWTAPAQASTALLPRALAPPGKASTAQTPAARAPSAAAPPSTEGPAASPARKHARGETAAARRSAQRSEHVFSFKDWLQQIGIVRRDTRG